MLTFKKSHTCEEGGANFRVTVWHLLMNLKDNYLFKKLLLKVLNFNIYHVVFKKNNK